MRALFSTPEVKGFINDPLLRKELNNKLTSLKSMVDTGKVEAQTAAKTAGQIKTMQHKNTMIGSGVALAGGITIAAASSTFIGAMLAGGAFVAGTAVVTERITSTKSIQILDELMNVEPVSAQ